MAISMRNTGTTPYGLTDRQALEALAKWGWNAPVLDQCTPMQWLRVQLAMGLITRQAQEGRPLADLKSHPLIASIAEQKGL